MITRRLNPQAIAIEDAQTEIKLAIKSGVLSGTGSYRIMAQIQKIISAALKNITNNALKEAALTSLNRFALYAYGFLSSQLGSSPNKKIKSAKKLLSGKPATWEETAAGIPNQEYAKDYIKRVNGVIGEFAKKEALDPGDIGGRNSLRNRAEMEVRYQRQQDRVSELKEKKVRLVVASTHADSSGRCFPWQGRVYSLDGTSGVTKDGREYVPLERATNIFYTTKAGKTYANGLLGFNCRHYLYEYKVGMGIPFVSKKRQEQEYKINMKQRKFENRIRGEKEKALMYKDIDRERYLKARANAIRLNKEYIKYSHDNDRAYYPDRTKILN